MAKKKKAHKKLGPIGFIALSLIALTGIAFSLPAVLALALEHQQNKPLIATRVDQFPVTVDPKNKAIIDDPIINSLLDGDGSPLQASVIYGSNPVTRFFTWLSTKIASIPWYKSIASVSGRFVTITPGLRKEEVADAFAHALDWNKNQTKEFEDTEEGSFAPGVYVMSIETTPVEAKAMIDKRFYEDVLSHYGTSTSEVVPIDQALTIASLIQRETLYNDDMRLISGIIWNRLFINMKLQLDATLQYAKANTTKNGSWWPAVVPKDKYIQSPYNTYLNQGLPPAAIANPSVAAIIAALNPIKTDCLFYFNDKKGNIHCTKTYPEHVKLLRKYY